MAQPRTATRGQDVDGQMQHDDVGTEGQHEDVSEVTWRSGESSAYVCLDDEAHEKDGVTGKNGRSNKNLDSYYFCYYKWPVTTRLTWDEAKRKANVAKHGLDFADAAWVLESEIRMDVVSVQGNEVRTAVFAYVFDVLAVLLLVHVEREDEVRLISFRRASREEREEYYEWLEADDS